MQREWALYCLRLPGGRLPYSACCQAYEIFHNRLKEKTESIVGRANFVSKNALWVLSTSRLGNLLSTFTVKVGESFHSDGHTFSSLFLGPNGYSNLTVIDLPAAWHTKTVPPLVRSWLNIYSNQVITQISNPFFLVFNTLFDTLNILSKLVYFCQSRLTSVTTLSHQVFRLQTVLLFLSLRANYFSQYVMYVTSKISLWRR